MDIRARMGRPDRPLTYVAVPGPAQTTAYRRQRVERVAGLLMLRLIEGRHGLRAYQIAAANDGHALSLGTTDTAADALQKLWRALEEYGRAWVTDHTGADVSIAELTARANEEGNYDHMI